MTRPVGALLPRPVLLDVLGERVAVDAGGHLAAAQVESLWSRCRVDEGDGVDATSPGHEPHISLPRSDRPLASEHALGLTTELTAAAIAAGSGRLLLLRAAAVATPDGAVLGLVSADDRGRTSAAAEFSRRGFCYVTDELLAVDESLGVVPFAKPLVFAEPGSEHPTQAGPDALGLRACGSELRLAALVVLDCEDTHEGAATLTRLPSPDDVRALVGAVVSTPGSVPSVQALTGAVAAVDGVWVLRYAEAYDAAPLLAQRLRERTRPVRAPGQVFVAAGIGESTDEGRTVNVRGYEVELDDLRRAVWQGAAGGASLESLHNAANRELGGSHRISVQLVSAAVNDLLALGLLVAR